MTERTLILGTDVLTGYLQPVANSTFSFLGKIPIQFTKTDITSGKQIQAYSQIGFTVQTFQNKTIFTRNPSFKPKGRGSQVQVTGDSGLKFDTTLTLAGRFFSARNQIFQLLDSGEPLWLYDPFFQKINSAKAISSINKEQETRNRFYVKVSDSPTISQDDRNIATCTIRVSFQEIPYKPAKREQNRFSKIVELIDNLGNRIDGIEADIATVTLALNSLNNLLYDTANRITSFGQDVSTLLNEIQSFATKMPSLISAPKNLATNLVSLYKSTSDVIKTAVTQNQPLNTLQTSVILSNIKSFINLDVEKPSTSSTYNSRKYTDLNAVKAKIVAGKIVFPARAFGLILLIYILEDLPIFNKQEALSILNILEASYAKLMLDDSYNGFKPSQSKVKYYTDSPRDESLFYELTIFYAEAVNYLKKIEITLLDDLKFTVKETSNIFDLVFKHYASDITPENFDDILEKFRMANNVQSLSKLFLPGDTIIYPIFY